MANDIPQNLKYTPIGVEGVIEVNAHLARGNLLDSLRRTFTIDSQMDEGDYFMDRSLGLLEKHFKLMRLIEQNNTLDQYLKLVSNYLCCAVESLNRDTPTYQSAAPQTQVTLRRIQWLLVPKVFRSQKLYAPL